MPQQFFLTQPKTLYPQSSLSPCYRRDFHGFGLSGRRSPSPRLSFKLFDGSRWNLNDIDRDCKVETIAVAMKNMGLIQCVLEDNKPVVQKRVSVKPVTSLCGAIGIKVEGPPWGGHLELEMSRSHHLINAKGSRVDHLVGDQAMYQIESQTIKSDKVVLRRTMDG